MEKEKPAPLRHAYTRAALIALPLIVLAFLIGWLPKELEGRRLTSTLRATELELRLANLHRELGVASHEAMRGNYPGAGVAAMSFFDGCRTLAESRVLDERIRTRTALGAYAGNRDTFLEKLAAADPEVGPQLSSLYLTMNGVIERRQ
jgi:hypothetical protein